MKITAKETKEFIFLSKDKNRIHFDKKFASQFFFKEPIVHGINIVIKALLIFFKKKSNKIIKNISIDFKNFLLIDEKYEIKIYRNRIIIFNDINIKVEIYLEHDSIKKKMNLYKAKKNEPRKYNYVIKNLINKSLINHLIYISYSIGTIKPGNGSLIHKINLQYNDKLISGKKILHKKMLNNAYEIGLESKFFKSNIIASKLVPFNYKHQKIRLSKKSLLNIKNKNILIFGIKSDLGKRLDSVFKKYSKIHSHSFRVNFEKPEIHSKELKELNKKLIKIRPSYIFFFSSPRIYRSHVKKKKLYTFYNTVYVKYLSLILKFVIRNKLQTKIFNPSTSYVEEKYRKNNYKLSAYINAKIKSEEVCRAPKYRKYIRYARVPMLKTRSNYNILGFYEGESYKKFDKSIDSFLKN